MPLYRDSAAGVRALLDHGELVSVMTEQFRHQIGHRPSPSEQRSWERSLHVLVGDLLDAGLDDIEMLLEYQLPLTSKRADAVLCGVHPRTGEPSYIVVELKQWSEASPLEGTDDVVLLDGVAERLHPVEQVRRYCTHLTDFLGSLSDHESRLTGVAYLHNATDLDVDGLWTFPQSDHGRMFTGQRRGEFLRFLQGKLAAGSGAGSADELLSSVVRPSKQLLALAADEV